MSCLRCEPPCSLLAFQAILTTGMLPFESRDYRVSKRSRLDGELVVGPSLAMSNFCYTILRLDPYIGCGHSCVYCYTRFFPSLRRSQPAARVDYPKLLEAAVEKLRRAGLELPPLHMSALTEPFQPLERKLALSLRLLRAALRMRVPLLISTKSTLVAEPPWLDAVKELAGEGLAAVQLSVAFLEDGVAKALEPGAPPPSERLRAAEKLSSEGVPLVLRMQPLVPYLNSGEEYAERYAEAARAVGARHVIAEALRISSWRDLAAFRKVMSEEAFRKLVNPSLWERFPLGSHKHPRRELRARAYSHVKASAERRGLTFATCREGFYTMWSSPDCCGVFLLSEKVLRYTLYELLHGPRHGYKYLTPEDYRRIPLPEMRRKLLAHHKIAESTARNPSLVSTLTL